MPGTAMSGKTNPGAADTPRPAAHKPATDATLRALMSRAGDHALVDEHPVNDLADRTRLIECDELLARQIKPLHDGLVEQSVVKREHAIERVGGYDIESVCRRRTSTPRVISQAPR